MIISKMRGCCPKCGCDELTYDDTQMEADMVGYEFICDNCGAEGIEWYNLDYTESIIYEEQP